MKQIIISTRDLKIAYEVDGLTADQIAENLSKAHGVTINGSDVAALIRERGIQQKNVKRSTRDWEFVNPDAVAGAEQPVEEAAN